MDDFLKKATNQLFYEREEFIIIGLTGRTGAGCSTVSNILCSTFDELKLIEPKRTSHKDNEERKYEIIYDYAKQHWKKFDQIEMRSIITSFILEHDFNELENYICKLKKNITSDLTMTLNDLKCRYDELHKERIKIQNKLSGTVIENMLDKDISFLKDYYFTQIPNFTNRIQESLNAIKITENITINDNEKSITGNLFTYLYQEFGKNIRSSGNPYNSDFIGENIFKLSERANKLIKILRRENRLFLIKNPEERRGVRVVIDSIRNPFEATFFKDRYSAFYLFSINIPDQVRTERLFHKNFSKDDIELINIREEIKTANSKEIFYSQNIQSCIELSDIFISNESTEKDLTSQTIRYITLIMHPGLITPTHIERCMQIAFNAKVNSGCISRQVGAVITDKDYNLKSIGWNSVPAGQIPCNLRHLNKLVKTTSDDQSPYSVFEYNNPVFKSTTLEQYTSTTFNGEGRIRSYCFKDIYNTIKKTKNQVYTRSLHAEENAFLQISKYGGQGLEGGKLFTSASPCELCAKKAYHIGIKEIYYIDPYPGITEDHILNSGILNPKMILFTGAIGRAYTQLYTPVIPYKDELKMLTKKIVKS